MAINFIDPLAALERSTALTSSGLPYSFARKFSQYGLSPERETPYMSPQDEQSALMELGQMGAHAIGTVGALLDVPGAMVRNALVGKNVFDPLSSPLTTAGRATGRDVLKQYGIMGDTDKSLPWYSPERLARGAAGLGAEVLLDPTTYLTFGLGSAAKAGRALQALGKPAHRELAELMGVGMREAWTKGSLDMLLGQSPNANKYLGLLEDFAAKNATTLDALKSERLGSAMGLHVPFTHLTAPISTPLDRLAPNVDAFANTMATSAIGRGLQAITNPHMMNTTSEAVQAVAPKVFDETLDLTAEARSQVEPLLSAAYSRGWLNPVDISKTTGLDMKTTARHMADDLGNDMLHYIETKTPIDLTKYPHVNANDATEMYGLLDRYRTIADESFKRDVDEYGIAMRELDKPDFFYAHRSVHRLPDDNSFRFPGKRPFSVEKSYQRDRAPFMRYLPTKMLNEISLDPEFSGAASKFTTVAEDFYKTQGDLLESKYGSQYAPTLIGQKVKWGSVARWASDLDPRYAELRIPYYRTDPFETLTKRIEASAQARGAADGVFKLMSTHVAKEVRGTAGPSRDLVSSTFKDMPALGKGEEGVKQFAAMEKWMDSHFADPRNADLRDDLLKEIGQDWKIKGDDFSGTEKWAQSLSIPSDVASDMKRIMATFSEPEALQGFVRWYDTMLNKWKKWVTIPWPSFHTRNMWSGFARNLAAGHVDPRDYENAFRLMTANKMGGGVAERYFGTGTKLTDAQAVDKLRNELFSNRIVSHHAGMQDLASPIGGQLVDVPGVTHMMQPSMLMPDANAWSKATDPWIRAGSAGSYFVEGQNRIGAYLNMRAKGMSPSAAAEKIRALQVEYSPQFATEADRRIRRLLPFWTFHKNVVPWTIKSLIEHPGGVIAQTSKRTATMRSGTPLLPENVQQTAAIQIPSDEPGGMKFISTLGFMEEPLYGTAAPLLQVPFSMAQAVGLPVKAGATPMQAGGEFVREILSQSNPFIKGLAEWAFGRSSYFGGGEAGGRELRSLTPPVGQLVSRIAGLAGADYPVHPMGISYAEPITRPLEYFAGAMPSSRFISTLSGLVDPRKNMLEKAVNLGLGIKTTDVSAAQMAAQTNEALRNAMTAYGARTFIKPYFRPEDLANMDAVARRQADLLNNMSRWMSYKAKQAKN